MVSHDDLVIALYRGIHGREPDAIGFRHFARRLDEGYPLERAVRDFIDSDEFRRTARNQESRIVIERIPSADPVRATDDDWRVIGAEQPYFGVMTNEIFLRENMTPQALAEFWQSGETAIDRLVAVIKSVVAPDFSPRNALDFGCGVGRLTRPMAKLAARVVGYDISPGMLVEARQHAVPNIDYVAELPADAFDWINSLIVFQHIPPARGYEIFETLLTRLAIGGVLSAHFTIFRDQRVINTVMGSVRDASWDGATMRVLREAPAGQGSIMMYDYDLTRLVAAGTRAGIERFHLLHTDHGGCHGVQLLGRRE